MMTPPGQLASVKLLMLFFVPAMLWAQAGYYATRLRGGSNEKARHGLNFRSRPLEWLRAVPAQRG